MHAFSVVGEAEFNPKKHVEKILGKIGDGDVTVACWEPGQTAPIIATRTRPKSISVSRAAAIMRTPRETIDVVPGAFVVHPPGEVHEYENGDKRTLLFRVRYGTDMAARHLDWRGRDGFKRSAEDADYYRRHPVGA